MKRIYCLLMIVLMIFSSCYQVEKKGNNKIPVNESTPSKSMYFDWININWYGGNEHKVISNLQFFKWMHDEYGMELDIYLLDAGNVDNGPNCNGCEVELKNAPRYGGVGSEWFKQKYPNGLDSIVNLAKSFGCKIGLWIGPDGYGDSDSTARKRIDMLEKLTRDYDIALFKMDACCSDLKPENEKYFVEAMRKCYSHNPELIVLNHRITLSDSAKKFTTTFLWQGAETYIDVSSRNNKPAPHHRYTLERGLPPELKRLTEDHGVCLSSYLDYWEDDLILQAFNRNLILAPEIYGNPWLLRDDEFPLLARIFNLHKKYNSILLNAKQLPEKQYGMFAVSRGNGSTRLVTLRNLSWETKKYTIDLTDSIGIEKAGQIEVRQYHPFEKRIGIFNFGQSVDIEVLPFRSCLLKISSDLDEFGIDGCNYQVIKDIQGQDIEIDLLAMPGEEKKIKLVGSNLIFKKAFIDGKEVNALSDKNYLSVKFEGSLANDQYHRLLSKLCECQVPSKSAIFFETMYFSADNNCLEIRSLIRSGDTKIEAVKNARYAFFKDEVFINIGAWDRLAFDNDTSSSFKVRQYCNLLKPGILRLRLPSAMQIDRLILEGLELKYKPREALVSNDLINWQKLNITQKEGKLELINISGGQIKFIKLNPAPLNVSEAKAYSKNQPIDISKATLSNLFPDNTANQVKRAWKGSFKLDGLTKNSTISVAIEGEYGDNNAFTILQINDSLIGAFDRSPAFDCNNWEHTKSQQIGNYTYYFKIPENKVHSEITVFVFGLNNVEKIKIPEVWLTAYPIPFEKKRLVLK